MIYIIVYIHMSQWCTSCCLLTIHKFCFVNSNASSDDLNITVASDDKKKRIENLFGRTNLSCFIKVSSCKFDVFLLKTID